jgi:cyclohexadienyl dehydratase
MATAGTGREVVPVSPFRALRALAAVLAVAVPGLVVAAELAAPVPAPPLWNEATLVDRVLLLVDERLALMPLVAAAKWQHHQPAPDPAREAKVIAAAGERARRLGLEPAPVEALLALQIRFATDRQQQLIGHWDASGYDGPPAPDLANELRPRIDRLSGELLGALYLLAPYATSDGFAVRVASAAERGLPAARWSSADRLALAEHLAAVRADGPGNADRARAAGLIRFGTPADYAPFSAAGAGSVSGADIELALDLAGSLGLEPVFLHSSWRTLVEDLKSGRFDVAIGGVSATPARLREAEASVALARSGKTALGRCADKDRFASLARIDEPGVTVVENPGGTNEAFARAHLGAARLRVHTDNLSVFEEILARRADVMFTDETEVSLATRRHPTLCRLLSDSYEAVDKVFLYGRGRGFDALADAPLKEAVAAGRPALLLERYSTP